MRHRTFTLLIVCLILFSTLQVFAQNKPCASVPTDAQDSKYRPGQVWAYRARPGEATSTLTVLRVEQLQKIGTIVHIRLDGLQVHNPRGDLVTTMPHMPFTRDALLVSTTKLLSTGLPVPLPEGYDYWREHCGGVYTISVADAVSIMEKTWNSR